MAGAKAAVAVDWSKGAAWQRARVMPIAEAGIGVTDWALTHSDVTYDVVMVIDGAFFRLDDHLDRFEASMAALHLRPVEDRAAMRAALHAVVAASGLHKAYVSMVCARGVPTVPGARDPRLCANHFFAWCVPYVHVIPADVAARGAHLWVAKGVRRIGEGAVDPRVKNYHWGDFTAGLFEAYDNGCDTAVLMDSAGNIAEGPGFNVFAVIEGRIVTPAGHCLHGITRRTVLEAAAEAGIATEIRDLPMAEFLSADEVFTVTSGGGVAPVTRVDGRILGNDAPGPLTGRMVEAYWAMTEREVLREPVDYAPVD
ncbi:MAG: aminotransferase class IV [Pseudomonadota bacterium]